MSKAKNRKVLCSRCGIKYEPHNKKIVPLCGSCKLVMSKEEQERWVMV